MEGRKGHDMPEVAGELKPADRLAVDIVEAAALLGISEKHFRNLNSRGCVPMPVKLGKSPRWAVDELRAWLAAGGPTRERWEAIKAADRK